jgi:hypothetical protein
MNKLICVAAISFSLSAPVALAVDEHHPDQKTAPTKDAGMPMDKMQDNMLKMHEKMHQIMQSKDATERKQLMKEHKEMMQEHMKTMREGKGSMMDSGMMGEEGKDRKMGGEKY